MERIFSKNLEEDKNMKEVLYPVSANEADDIIVRSQTLPTLEEEEREERVKKLRSHVVSMTTVFPADEYLLKVGDVGIMARKDIVCIKAKEKAGKTTLISILISTILCGQWEGVLSCPLSDLKVLYIDTEMKEADTQGVGRKALRIAELDEMTDDNHLMLINLRKEDMESCQELISQYIEDFEPDIVFIDGIVDLCKDFNDIQASQALVKKHMELAELFNCCIVEVLHTNKSLDDHNMRGHLGTILSQKSSLVSECKKDKQTNIVTVECSVSRHAPFDSFHFGFDHEGFPVNKDAIVAFMEDEKAKTKKEKKDAEKAEKNEKLKSLVNAIYSEHPGCMSKTRLVEFLITEGGIKRTTAYGSIVELINDGFLCIAADGKSIALSASMSAEQSNLDFEPSAAK